MGTVSVRTGEAAEAPIEGKNGDIMSELLSQLITPEIQAAFSVVVVLLAILYILSIVWVARDAYLRGTYWYVWGIVALVPLVGVVAYCLLRPPLLQIDRDEQELEVALKQRQLMHYGECANCGYPVESDYVLCPNCHQRLKNLCGHCGHALEPAWTVCPYCASPVSGQRQAARRAPQPQAAPRPARSAHRSHASRGIGRTSCRTGTQPSDRTARFDVCGASRRRCGACAWMPRQAAREAPMHAADLRLRIRRSMR